MNDTEGALPVPLRWVIFRARVFIYLFILENAGEEEKRQFLLEIDLMKDVGSHPNILSIFGFWVRSEPIMLIMEYVPQGDLLQWLRNKRQQVKLVYIHQFLPFSLFRISTFGIHFASTGSRGFILRGIWVSLFAYVYTPRYISKLDTQEIPTHRL